jgi:hypothetical protein
MPNLMVACEFADVRICTVSVVDVRGIRHTVEVEAPTLYQAVALGLKRLKKDSRVVRVGDARLINVTVGAVGAVEETGKRRRTKP